MTNLEKIQKHVGTKVDDDWGPKTQKAVSISLGLLPDSSVEDIQKEIGASVDGEVGPETFGLLIEKFDLEKTPPASDLAEVIVELAKGEVGTRENGRNTGEKVREYQSADWLDGTGYAWCASFVCYIVRKAGERIPLPFARPRTAGAWDFERWARDQDLPLVKNPTSVKAGDIVVFKFSHIGIAVEDSKNGYVKTVEGNTNKAGSREGDGVYYKTRKLSQIRSKITL